MSQIKLNKALFQKKYIEVFNYITSSSFRAPIKSFIDENCDKINKTTVNSSIPHEDHVLHQDFIRLIEVLLSVIKEDLKISDVDFIEISKIGLEREKEKEYFEQIIACESIDWFRNCLIKRNLQLKEQAMKMMYVNMGDQKLTKDSTINSMMKSKEEAELELAIAMSLAADEEKSKLYVGENFEEAVLSSKSEAENLNKTINDSKIVEEFQKKLEKVEEKKKKEVRRESEIHLKKEEDEDDESKKKKENVMEDKNLLNKNTEKTENNMKKQEQPQKQIENNNNNNEKEEEDSKKVFVKVSKIKPHLQRYTPSYQINTKSNTLSTSDKSTVISENDFKKVNIEKKSVDISNYLIGVNNVNHKVDCHLNRKDFPSVLDDVNQLDDQFSKLTNEEKKNFEEYRKKILKIQDEARRVDVENELKEEERLKGFIDRIGKI